MVGDGSPFVEYDAGFRDGEPMGAGENVAGKGPSARAGKSQKLRSAAKRMRRTLDFTDRTAP